MYKHDHFFHRSTDIHVKRCKHLGETCTKNDNSFFHKRQACIQFASDLVDKNFFQNRKHWKKNKQRNFEEDVDNNKHRICFRGVKIVFFSTSNSFYTDFPYSIFWKFTISHKIHIFCWMPNWWTIKRDIKAKKMMTRHRRIYTEQVWI